MKKWRRSWPRLAQKFSAPTKIVEKGRLASLSAQNLVRSIMYTPSLDFVPAASPFNPFEQSCFLCVFLVALTFGLLSTLRSKKNGLVEGSPRHSTLLNNLERQYIFILLNIIFIYIFVSHFALDEVGDEDSIPNNLTIDDLVNFSSRFDDNLTWTVEPDGSQNFGASFYREHRIFWMFKTR